MLEIFSSMWNDHLTSLPEKLNLFKKSLDVLLSSNNINGLIELIEFLDSKLDKSFQDYIYDGKRQFIIGNLNTHFLLHLSAPNSINHCMKIVKCLYCLDISHAKTTFATFVAQVKLNQIQARDVTIFIRNFSQQLESETSQNLSGVEQEQTLKGGSTTNKRAKIIKAEEMEIDYTSNRMAP